MEMKEKDFPCYYIDSNKASKNSQYLYKGMIMGSLLLMFISTILVSVDIKIMSTLPWFDRVNGLILFTSSCFSIVLTIFKPEKKWYLGRAISESIKTLTWRYMMQASPFRFETKSTDLKNFSERIEEINTQANADNFIPKPNKIHLEIITPKMSEIRSMNFMERKAFYAKERIEDQIKWYGQKSEWNKFRASFASVAIILAQLLAAIYLFGFIDTFKSFNFNNVMVFFATSIITIVELNKYKELHQSYAFTKQELNVIRTKFSTITDDDELDQFVIESEQAISREHTTWIARRGVKII